MTRTQTICLTILICVESVVALGFYSVWSTNGRVDVDIGKQVHVEVGE